MTELPAKTFTIRCPHWITDTARCDQELEVLVTRTRRPFLGSFDEQPESGEYEHEPVHCPRHHRPLREEEQERAAGELFDQAEGADWGDVPPEIDRDSLPYPWCSRPAWCRQKGYCDKEISCGN